mmetsp:Transcript_32002/g.28363  ORF Transcript_32002/g.28363 Transcript_32002/m.28363 type:complete len:199 (-) Transcript_32002:624-1220(-)
MTRVSKTLNRNKRMADADKIHKENKRILKRLQDTKSNYESLNSDFGHMWHIKGLAKYKSKRDMVTGIENLKREDRLDLSNNVEMSNPIMERFPEKEKLQEAFTADPFEGSIYSKSNHQTSFEKLPSLSSYTQSKADSAISSYLGNKVFGKKKYGSVSNTKIGAKNIKLDPSRVIVFKKGRALSQGYFVLEFSYTTSYF